MDPRDLLSRVCDRRVISDIVKRRSFRVSERDRKIADGTRSRRFVRSQDQMKCFVGLLLDRRSRRFDLASWSF
jgi:hypothetical protein